MLQVMYARCSGNSFYTLLLSQNILRNIFLGAAPKKSVPICMCQKVTPQNQIQNVLLRDGAPAVCAERYRLVGNSQKVRDTTHGGLEMPVASIKLRESGGLYTKY